MMMSLLRGGTRQLTAAGRLPGREGGTMPPAASSYPPVRPAGPDERTGQHSGRAGRPARPRGDHRRGVRAREGKSPVGL